MQAGRGLPGSQDISGQHPRGGALGQSSPYTAFPCVPSNPIWGILCPHLTDEETGLLRKAPT